MVQIPDKDKNMDADGANNAKMLTHQEFTDKLEKAHVNSLVEELAALGYVCEKKELYHRELAEQIESRLVARMGEDVYQSAKIVIQGFPRQATENLFQDKWLVPASETPENTKTWKFDCLLGIEEWAAPHDISWVGNAQ